MTVRLVPGVGCEAGQWGRAGLDDRRNVEALAGAGEAGKAEQDRPLLGVAAGDGEEEGDEGAGGQHALGDGQGELSGGLLDLDLVSRGVAGLGNRLIYRADELPGHGVEVPLGDGAVAGRHRQVLDSGPPVGG